MEIINNWCKLHKDKNISDVVQICNGRIILKQYELIKMKFGLQLMM